ncbi:uncharacterized protein LOC134693804 [Mytilus trossulus]|uniref:uncharacterized protein LOC134693804 n=1 Tax=Mytilus trossulus TaxID=6551 RepID=UPI003004F439
MWVELVALLMFSAVITNASKCCLPSQMEGSLGLSMGYQIQQKGFGTEALFQLAFDVKGKRKSMLGEGRTNGIPFKTHEIDDYAAGKKYTVTNGKCVVSVLKVEMVSCIPSDAKLLMSTFVGYGDKKIDIDMYSFSFNGANITMSVTKDSCVPVSQHLILPGVFIDLGYMGMTSGIRNTTVFNIPKPCQQIGTFEHQQNDVEHMGHRRHTPSVF